MGREASAVTVPDKTRRSIHGCEPPVSHAESGPASACLLILTTLAS